MSLDVALTAIRPSEVFSENITHNLVKMAEEAGLYFYLWRPDEIAITHAHQLIEPLTLGLEELTNNPEKYEAFNPENGWGSYAGFVDFVRNYLGACIEHPDAIVSACR